MTHIEPHPEFPNATYLADIPEKDRLKVLKWSRKKITQRMMSDKDKLELVNILIRRYETNNGKD